METKSSPGYTYMAINKKLPVVPLKATGVKAAVQDGFAYMNHMKETVMTELVFDAEVDGEIILKGTKVVFNGDVQATPWNKNVLSHEGIEFVLAPADAALLIGYKK